MTVKIEKRCRDQRSVLTNEIINEQEGLDDDNSTILDETSEIFDLESALHEEDIRYQRELERWLGEPNN